ncbi:uncharacterized protein LOC110272878 [Arachis duranensis]|uniref:Uncharacterized protein LOC110272878 n=1 Tax=Arachis duranensis TaxID=130453 RepID=A0A9C6WWU3_ARADU|nr:uncharacterized protein LOC110272878 [Arachis duranensis]
MNGNAEEVRFSFTNHHSHRSSRFRFQREGENAITHHDLTGAHGHTAVSSVTTRVGVAVCLPLSHSPSPLDFALKPEGSFRALRESLRVPGLYLGLLQFKQTFGASCVRPDNVSTSPLRSFSCRRLVGIMGDPGSVSLGDWVEAKYESRENPYRWWAFIKVEFIAIFRSIFEELKRLHLRDGFHGRLSMSRIKVQSLGHGQFHVQLTLPQIQRRMGMERMQLEDLKSLRTIIFEVVHWGHQGMSCEVQDQCIAQLDFAIQQRSRTKLISKWALDPVLLWDTSRKIQFLQTVYWLFFRNRSIPGEISIHFNLFPSCSFQDNLSAEMKVVYYHEALCDFIGTA